MYEESPKLEPPSDSRQPLWRYMPAHRLKELLTIKKIFFCNLHSLTDGLEGTLTQRTRNHAVKWHMQTHKYTLEQAYQAVADYESFQKEMYVNCWHMNRHESYLMWKVYSNEKGYAIKTHYERIKSAFIDTPCKITGGKVTYVDFETEGTPLGNLFDHVATKDLPYEDEREFRLVYWDLKETSEEIIKTNDGFLIPVDINMLIQSIVESPEISDIDPELELLIYEYGIPIQRSKIINRKNDK